MRLFDIHAHMACEYLSKHLDSVIARMHKNEIVGGMAICDPGDLEPDYVRTLEIVREHPEFSLAVACHPQNALHFSEKTETVIREIAALPVCRCIGETGLDYYDNQSSREQQISVLERHLDIALEYDLPVQLHVRKAHGDMLDVLSRRKREKRLPRIIMHCFTGSAELARAYLRMGAYISIGGPITYLNANKLLETARQLPADRLLIETDAPWVSPEPHRGVPNEPAYLKYIFEKISALKEIDSEILAERLWENVLALKLCNPSFVPDK